MDSIDFEELAEATYVQHRRLEQLRELDDESDEDTSALAPDEVLQPAPRQSHAASQQRRTLASWTLRQPARQSISATQQRRTLAQPVKQEPGAVFGSPRASISTARSGAAPIKQEPGRTPGALTMQEGKGHWPNKAVHLDLTGRTPVKRFFNYTTWSVVNCEEEKNASAARTILQTPQHKSPPATGPCEEDEEILLGLGARDGSATDKAAEISKAACSTDAFRAATDRAIEKENEKVAKVVIYLLLVDINLIVTVLFFAVINLKSYSDI